uniref:Uncharacterized protein n=1 Tax=Arundo donax TaxID=35708 RepID=A0A0A9FM31_ARUDO
MSGLLDYHLEHILMTPIPCRSRRNDFEIIMRRRLCI